MVIDADGLNIISRFNMKIDYPYGTIMTPHLMEAARLMSCDITQIKEDLCQSAQDLAEKYHCTAVLKDATTIVAREDDLVYINQSGNDGMATGGSGDILAGMIIGLLGKDYLFMRQQFTEFIFTVLQEIMQSMIWALTA